MQQLYDGDKNNFINLDESFKSKIKLEDSNQVNVEGKGDITIEIEGCNSKLIILYVHSHHKILLNVGQLMDTEYTLKFDDSSFLIIDKKKTK